MDIATIVTAVVSSLGGSTAVAYWLAKEIVKNRLQRDLEERKAELAQQLETFKLGLNQDLERTRSELQFGLNRDKALLEGAIHKEVETQLGEGAAQRQYELEARRRLYLAIGPLRFQLLLACRDLAGRVESFAKQEQYSLDLASYYGRSTLHRILRPIAISELIEEQVALADFSIDPGAIDCLRFRRTMTRIFSGDELVGDHPEVNWSSQEQHVFADSLSSCAVTLIAADEGSRILRFEEFCDLLDQKGAGVVAPFDALLSDFQLGTKPILWIRLVAYANACNELVKCLGGTYFVPNDFSIEESLIRGADSFVNSHLSSYIERIQSVQLVPL